MLGRVRAECCAPKLACSLAGRVNCKFSGLASRWYFPKIGNPNIVPNYYDPYYWAPQEVPLIFGKPPNGQANMGMHCMVYRSSVAPLFSEQLFRLIRQGRVSDMYIKPKPVQFIGDMEGVDLYRSSYIYGILQLSSEPIHY